MNYESNNNNKMTIKSFDIVYEENINIHHSFVIDVPN